MKTLEARNFRRQRLLALVASVLLPSLCCDAPPKTERALATRESKAVAPAASDVRTPVVMSLANRVSNADVWRPFADLDFEPPMNVDALSGGWYGIQPEKGIASVGSGGAVYDISIVEPRDVKLKLRLVPPEQQDLLPVQSVTVLWNGKRIGERELGWTPSTLEFNIRAALQRTGPNRLELLPKYWFAPALVGLGDSLRPHAFSCRGIEFETGQTETARPLTLDAETETIHLTPQSVVTFYIDVPEQGTLRGEVAPAPRGSRGKLTIRVLTEDLETTILVNERAARATHIEEDLSPWSGRTVGLTIAFHGPPAAGAMPHDGALSIGHLRVEGVRTERGRPQRVASSPPYNVLMVLFDTLRADLVPPADSHLETPNLARLAASGVAFRTAYAQSSWTRTSVASLLTATYPWAHKTLTRKDALPRNAELFQERLQRNGYRTVAVINNPHLSINHGFGRGFDVAHEYFRNFQQIAKQRPRPEQRAEYVWKELVEPAIEGYAPFFVYLHEINPHGPYNPPAPYDTLYGTGRKPISSSSAKTLALMSRHRLTSAFLESDTRALRNLYYGEISFMDGYLGFILDQLEASGLRENTLVVFLSDHGEEFLEHGQMGHEKTLFEESLRVPLLISLPGVIPTGTAATPAELVDVVPTILELLGLEALESAQGESLLASLLDPNPSDAAGTAYAKLRENEMVRKGDWKLIRTARRSLGFDYSLYDLANDPAEQVDVWSEQPVIGGRLRQLLAQQRERGAAHGFVLPERIEEVEPEIRDQLRALGYLD